MKTRIIIATLLQSDGPTGVQAHFNALRDYMQEHGYPVCIVTPFNAPRIYVYPIFAVRWIIDRVNGSASVWWYRYWHYQFLKLALQDLLKDGKPVIVYAQCPLSAKAALEVRSFHTQRVVMITHFNISQADEWADKGKIPHGGAMFRHIQKLEQEVLPRLDGMVYVSRFMQEQIGMRIAEIKRVHSVVIPNFVSPAAVRGCDINPCDLINIGTLEYRKNQRFLLEVLMHANQLGRRYTLSLVGDGPDRVFLEEMARENGIAGQVRFLGSQTNAACLIKGHRVYLHSSLMESFGIVLIEAMAAGVPVMAAPVGGVPEVFNNGREGYYWSLDDPLAGARRLIDLMEAPGRLEEMSKAARERYLQAFTTRTVAARLLDFLYKVQPVHGVVT